MPSRKRDNHITMSNVRDVRRDDQPPFRTDGEGFDGTLDLSRVLDEGGHELDPE